jgi:hypothetical protein
MLGFPWWKGGVAQGVQPAEWRVSTRFVEMPGLLTGECRMRGGVGYLSVSAAPLKQVALADAVVGTAAIGDVDWPDWGLHVIDLNLVMGDLLRRVAEQAP